MTGKISIVIEHDEHGYYAYCPELRGCQSEGTTFEEVRANIQEAIELYCETLSPDELRAVMSKDIYTTAMEVSFGECTAFCVNPHPSLLPEGEGARFEALAPTETWRVRVWVRGAFTHNSLHTRRLFTFDNDFNSGFLALSHSPRTSRGIWSKYGQPSSRHFPHAL